MGIVEWRIEVSKRNMDIYNKNGIEIVADKVRYFKFFMNMILPATHSEDDYSWCVNAVTMKCLRWPAPLEVFLIQSTVSDSRTNEENVNIKLWTIAIVNLTLIDLPGLTIVVVGENLLVVRKVRHTNVVQFIGACTKPSNLCIVTGNDDRVCTSYRRQIDYLILLVLLDKNWNFCMDNDFCMTRFFEVHSDLEIHHEESVLFHRFVFAKISEFGSTEVLTLCIEVLYVSALCDTN
ncbi:hypothetical protein Tco_0400642 [Tanacetum coccineum]